MRIVDQTHIALFREHVFSRIFSFIICQVNTWERRHFLMRSVLSRASSSGEGARCGPFEHEDCTTIKDKKYMFGILTSVGRHFILDCTEYSKTQHLARVELVLPENDLFAGRNQSNLDFIVENRKHLVSASSFIGYASSGCIFGFYKTILLTLLCVLLHQWSNHRYSA